MTAQKTAAKETTLKEMRARRHQILFLCFRIQATRRVLEKNISSIEVYNIANCKSMPLSSDRRTNEIEKRHILPVQLQNNSREQ